MTHPNYTTYEQNGYPDSTYTTGTTVRMSALFADWEGEATEPALVKFILYTSTFEKLSETSVSGRLSDGSYYHDFHHLMDQSLIYEWYAEIEGTPSLKRGRITFKKV